MSSVTWEFDPLDNALPVAGSTEVPKMLRVQFSLEISRLHGVQNRSGIAVDIDQIRNGSRSSIELVRQEIGANEDEDVLNAISILGSYVEEIREIQDTIRRHYGFDGPRGR